MRKEVSTMAVETHMIFIPPRRAELSSTEAWHTFRRDTLLLSLFPHMHLRGKSVSLRGSVSGRHEGNSARRAALRLRLAADL